MKTLQKTLLVFVVFAALCALMVAVVNAAPAAPNGPIAITKTVSPKVIDVNYTGLFTYTITLTNTAAQGLNAVMTDVLPIPLSFNGWVSYPSFGTRTVVGDVITWTGLIPPIGQNVVTLVFTAKLPDPGSATFVLRGPIVNTAYVSSSGGTDSASAGTTVMHYIYLPLVMRNVAQ
ncbi:MAG TPA: hypothetical protein PKZ84_02040 [Anaerolineae bacterium]|nr:hypothetical protein [Anaerolineae bacterium]HQI83639.1 hypothetical protein [Anaerolineae bacterium]